MVSLREEWRPVNGPYTGFGYEVSNIGRVRKIGVDVTKKRTRDSDGYFKTHLTGPSGERKTAKVHRLVLMAFGRLPHDGEQVNHKDGDKTNNNISNLEWVTTRENLEHAVRIGLRGSMGLGHFRRKLTPDQVREIRGLTKGMSDAKIGRLYGVSFTAIRFLRIGKTYNDVA